MYRLIAIALAGVLAGCAANAPSSGNGDGGASITISKGLWGAYQSYKNKLTSSSDDYFALATDGAWAWDGDKDKALKQCQDHSTGPTCILFAHNDQILVPYHVKQ